MKERNNTAAISVKAPVIGLPRALLYGRYEVLWKSFFSALGMKGIVSRPTNKEMIRQGSALAIDEACLSTKIYLGHVQALVGKCDYILVPRISNFGLHRNMCTKFESLYDLVCNVFRNTDQKFIAYNIDVLQKIDEEKGFRDLGVALGFDKKAVEKAYKKAKKAEADDWKAKVRAEEALYKKDGIKILVAGHNYVLDDDYIGHPVMVYLQEMGVTPIRADRVERKEALKQSLKVSPTLKWEMSRELVGSIQMHRDKVDGLILLSAFPCGPDSMVNEMIIRRMTGMPILNIVLDNQDGTAGLETRLESFTDILKLKRGEL
jgi:predicted nucleotide-binding protein (sugar kinase/HSP70/actin superfamily)